jgi:predicted Zn-dependent protease
MTATADTAMRVADRLRAVPAPWDVFAERTRRFEIHLNGPRIELIRGPIVLEGYGVRLLRPREKTLGIGFQASTDLSERGVKAAVEDAELVARHAEFPAPKAELPASSGAVGAPQVRDEALWRDPAGSLEGYVASLLAAFGPEKDVVPSFGSVKVTLTETTVANSAGLEGAFSHTFVESEIAVKASGGPEGRPPGEYWVNEGSRRLESASLTARVHDWARYARDVRRAVPPPNGEMPVILPPDVLEGILPQVLSFRFSGVARLRGLSPEPGTEIGAPGLEISDDGLVPWALRSSPLDDEGMAQRRHPLITAGKASEILYDSLYAQALGAASSGSAVRGGMYGRSSWRRFSVAPAPAAATIVIAPGTGGTDEELVESAGNGIWVQQIGWAQPEPISGSFGGEIRIGYRIRNGKLAEPVRGGTVGGQVVAAPGAPSLLHDLAGTGAKATLAGAAWVPPLLIGRLTVSGDAGAPPTGGP